MRVILFDIDTMRPDHLGCYGYHRDTSPAMDAVAKDGVKFEKYYCSDAPCLPSRAALVTGRFGIRTGIVGHDGTAADMRLEGAERQFWSKLTGESLFAAFRWSGFRTVSFSPFAERHGAWWFYSGLNEIHNTGRGGAESAEEITPKVMKWLGENADSDNWFLHVNYWDPHTPYRAPESFGNPFRGEPLPEWPDEKALAEHVKMAGPHTALDISMYNGNTNPKYPRQPGEVRDMKGLRELFDGYDCGIRYADDQVKAVVALLKERGVYEDTAIIITSDHGENMGELGVYAEHGTSDEITHRIPMIIKWPGARKGAADTGLHYNLDLLPTVLELFGKQPYRDADGRSYAASLKEGKDCGRDHLVLGQCCHVCQRSVRFGDWLYIRTYHDGFHLYPEKMLFNLKDDPHETVNLAAGNKAVCAKAEKYLKSWRGAALEMPDAGGKDPMDTVLKEGGPAHAKGKMLKKYFARLEETGRGGAIPALKKKHGRYLK